MTRDYDREYDDNKSLELLSQFASPSNYRNNAHLMPDDDRSDAQKRLDAKVTRLEYEHWQYDRR